MSELAGTEAPLRTASRRHARRSRRHPTCTATLTKCIEHSKDDTSRCPYGCDITDLDAQRPGPLSASPGRAQSKMDAINAPDCARRVSQVVAGCMPPQLRLALGAAAEFSGPLAAKRHRGSLQLQLPDRMLHLLTRSSGQRRCRSSVPGLVPRQAAAGGRCGGKRLAPSRAAWPITQPCMQQAAAAPLPMQSLPPRQPCARPRRSHAPHVFAPRSCASTRTPVQVRRGSRARGTTRPTCPRCRASSQASRWAGSQRHAAVWQPRVKHVRGGTAARICLPGPPLCPLRDTPAPFAAGTRATAAVHTHFCRGVARRRRRVQPDG